MTRIVLATSGSFGDLHPYLAVGLGLRARGHEVTLATAESYRAKVTSEGLAFHAMRPDIVPMASPLEVIRRTFDPFSGANFLIKELVIPYVEDTYCDLLDACRGADLLVSHPTLFPAPLVAEKLQLNWLSAVLSPGVFVSAYDPPLLPPIPWAHALRHFGPLPYQLLVPMMKAATKSWMRPIAEIRRREGLRPARCALHDDMFSPYGTLAFFSSVLGAVQPDWPAKSRITGFPIYDSKSPGQHLDPRMDAFLNAGPPPVVFTLGSSAVVDAGDFFEQSLAAVRRLGGRAVFLVGDSYQAPMTLSDENVIIAAYAPYSELFPRAAAIVHQGGIGTTGHALRAGVPSLVVPLGLDQPDNAFRAQRLGVARVEPRRRYNAAAAARHLHALLDSPEYRAAAQRIGKQVRSEDGVAAACDAIQEALALRASERKSKTAPVAVRVA